MNELMEPASKWLDGIYQKDFKILAQVLTAVENNIPGSQKLLESLKPSPASHIIGVTGPPGAGKSSLINCLIEEITETQKTVAVVAIDPTSPFNRGSLLGDRLRMSHWFTHPSVFIRSLATRGSLGGLSKKTIEVSEVLKAAQFDYILVETVGVGQSEVEIAGLADTTLVVLVPESGDEIQTMKSGIMEIADLFIINKSDREGADRIVANLQHYIHLHQPDGWQIPVLKTSALYNKGISETWEAIKQHKSSAGYNLKKVFLFTDKTYRLIQQERMKNISKRLIGEEVEIRLKGGTFNLFSFVKEFIKTHKL